MARRKKVFAMHAGDILKTEFMEPLGISTYRLAKDLNCPSMYDIVRGVRSITAENALRLAKYFGMTPQFWLNLQNDYDLRLAAGRVELAKIKPAKNVA